MNELQELKTLIETRIHNIKNNVLYDIENKETLHALDIYYEILDLIDEIIYAQVEDMHIKSIGSIFDVNK